MQQPSRREAEVLDLLGGRLTNAEIAERLYISVRTVESHVSSLLTKLGMTDRRALAAYASARANRSSRLPPIGPIGLVGRTLELERIGEAFKSATVETAPRFVLVSGEPGIGKSTLVSCFARTAHAAGAMVLYGRCDQDLAFPYRPFAEALGDSFADTSDAVWAGIGNERLAALAVLMPELARTAGSAPPAVDPEAERWMLFGAVSALLGNAASREPIVLMLDDLQWADRPTLQLLRHLSRNLAGHVLVMATYRDGELSVAHPLTGTLAALTTEEHVTQIRLRGLGDDEVVRYVEAAAGHPLNRAGVELAHAVYEETDGNPLFVSEVLRHLVESGAVVENDGRWVPVRELAQVGLPESLRHVIGSRVVRLGEEGTKVLSAASVLGQEFDVEVLSRMSGVDEDSVLDVLAAASAAALVAERAEPGRFGFSHALINRTLYEDLGPTRRARLHRAAAGALEDRLGSAPNGQAAELARHWLSATRPESKKAALYARLAGESALGALAPTEAIRWFEEALGVLGHVPDDEQRALCLAGLGEGKRYAGDSTYRETLLEAARLAQVTGQVDTLVRSALGNNRGFQSTSGDVDEERVTVLNAALGVVGSSDSGARARLLALLALERTWDDDAPSRRAIADEALEIARRLGDPAIVLDVLLRRMEAVLMPETLERLTAESEEAEAISEQIGDLAGSFWATGFRALLSVQGGSIAGVARAQEKLRRIASEVGQPALEWMVTVMDSEYTLLSGDITAAEALAARVWEIGSETGQPDLVVFYGVLIFHIRWHQSRLAEVADLVAQLPAEYRDRPQFRASTAHALAETGRDVEARALLDEEAASGFSAPDNFLLPAYLDMWARVATSLADRTSAETLYRRLSPWPTLVVSTVIGVHGAVAHNLGALAALLGEDDVADAHFAQALEIHETLRAPFFVALTKLEWGRLLLARPGRADKEQARRLLEAADLLARRHGYPGVARAAAAQRPNVR